VCPAGDSCCGCPGGLRSCGLACPLIVCAL
jgi:hypothetical protein